MLKITIAFVVGGAIGAASTYFSVRGKIEDEIEKECEELRLYYREKMAEIEKKPAAYYANNAVVHMPEEYASSENRKEIEEAYERLANEESPEDDDEYALKEPKPKLPPRLIKEEDWQTCPTLDKVNLYYYTEDDILTNEDDEVIDDPRYYIGNTLTKFDFKHNDEKVIYVRNEEIGTDFEIEKIWGGFQYR